MANFIERKDFEHAPCGTLDCDNPAYALFSYGGLGTPYCKGCTASVLMTSLNLDGRLVIEKIEKKTSNVADPPSERSR